LTDAAGSFATLPFATAGGHGSRRLDHVDDVESFAQARVNAVHGFSAERHRLSKLKRYSPSNRPRKQLQKTFVELFPTI
jgi:hypothetical protein